MCNSIKIQISIKKIVNSTMVLPNLCLSSKLLVTIHKYQLEKNEPITYGFAEWRAELSSSFTTTEQRLGRGGQIL